MYGRWDLQEAVLAHFPSPLVISRGAWSSGSLFLDSHFVIVFHLPSPLPLKTVLSNVQFLLCHQCLCCVQLRILN